MNGSLRALLASSLVVVTAATAAAARPDLAPDLPSLLTTSGPRAHASSGCGVLDDSYWYDGFKLPTHNGRVLAVVPDGNDLIVGGSFTRVGPEEAHRVARWDGTQWSGFGEGLPADVSALAFWNGRWIAGIISPEVGVDRPMVYERIGNQWLPLGTMRNGIVYALAVYDGELIAGGSFTHADGQAVGAVARWDGSAWHPVGSGLTTEVRRLVVFGDKLVAAGVIAAYGDIAQWDGTSWSLVGASFQGVNHQVRGLATDGTKLYACGEMESSGGHTFTGLPTWDGSTWSSLGTSSTVRRGHAIAVVAGAVCVTNSQGHIHRWTGTNWGALNNDFSGEARTLVAWGSKLVAANGVGTIPLREYNDIAVYSGGIAGSWSAIFDPWEAGSAGHFNGVTAAVQHGGQLVVGGGRVVGDQDHFEYTSGISRWDGTTWTSVGPPLGSGGVYALSVWSSDLIAGGYAILDNVGTTKYIARWNGSAWVGLGGGLSYAVTGLATYQNDLIAVGIFARELVGPTLNGIGRWNGSTWSPLGTGFAVDTWFGAYPEVALEFDGDLIVGGAFSAAGGVAAMNIARWDGAAWHDMAGGIDGEVYALASFGGDLIAGGEFANAGSGPARGAARWNGTSWSAMGTNAIEIEAVRVIGGRLFAAGEFHCEADDSEVTTLALWDGTNWKLLSSGFGEAAFRAIEEWNGDIYVGGGFTHVGETSSWGIARWSGLAAVAVEPGLVEHAPLRIAATPNPSFGPTTLRFTLPAAGRVRVAIHDLAGREVEVLADGSFTAGEHVVRWSGRTVAGANRRAGVYWARLQSPLGTRSVRLVRLD